VAERVLFVCGEYPPDIGGLGDYTVRLCSALEETGVSSAVLTRREVPRWDVRALRALARVASRVEIVHIEYQPAAFDLLGDICLAPLVVRARGGKVVTTLHDARVPYLFKGAGPLRPGAVRLLARTSHAVVAADERDLRFVGVRGRGHVVPIGSNVPCAPPPGYDRAAFRARLGVGADELAVVYFGLLNASKGLDVLLSAFSHVARTRAARLLVVGGGAGASDVTDEATAERVGAALEGLGSRVIRTGFLQPSEVSAHLLAGDVALLPYADGASPRRGSLLVCAEHGLPIVSTRPVSGAVADAVLAVEPHDAVSLAEAVLSVGADAALAERLRAASRALAECVSWRAIAARHAEIYARL
jgi:glycosyltransferase involved in cell wall biosynthesis